MIYSDIHSSMSGVYNHTEAYNHSPEKANVHGSRTSFYNTKTNNTNQGKTFYYSPKADSQRNSKKNSGIQISDSQKKQNVQRTSTSRVPQDVRYGKMHLTSIFVVQNTKEIKCHTITRSNKESREELLSPRGGEQNIKATSPGPSEEASPKPNGYHFPTEELWE